MIIALTSDSKSIDYQHFKNIKKPYKLELQEKYGVKVDHLDKKAWVEIKAFKDLSVASALPIEWENFIKSMLNRLNSNWEKLINKGRMIKFPKIENSIWNYHQNPANLGNSAENSLS